MNEISTEENSGNSIIEIRLDNGDDLDTNVAGPAWVIGGKKASNELLESITSLQA